MTKANNPVLVEIRERARSDRGRVFADIEGCQADVDRAVLLQLLFEDQNTFVAIRDWPADGINPGAIYRIKKYAGEHV